MAELSAPKPRVYWVPNVENPEAPTVKEIEKGVDITALFGNIEFKVTPVEPVCEHPWEERWQKDKYEYCDICKHIVRRYNYSTKRWEKV